jgi:hypothetical protein
MRHLLFTLLLLSFTTGVALARLGDPPNPYERIKDPAQAQQILTQVRADLQQMFGMIVSRPVDLHLVEGSEMDRLLSGNAYKGSEIGLYHDEPNGHHNISVMRDWSRDMCSGITAHEFTHAWQREHCPPNQDIVIKEGFARWVEAKYYDKIGAYAMVQRIREVADPVYGVGYKKMLEWESAYGVQGLVRLVQHISTVAEGTNAKP